LKGFILDIEARAVQFEQDNPDINVVKVDVDQLNSRQSLERLAEQLDLTPSQLTFELLVGFSRFCLSWASIECSGLLFVDFL